MFLNMNSSYILRAVFISIISNQRYDFTFLVIKILCISHTVLNIDKKRLQCHHLCDVRGRNMYVILSIKR